MSFRARIVDSATLREITPVALRAYATAQGWRRLEPYGEHSDVYVRDGAGEAIIPGNALVADYARIVSDIIAVLAKTEQRDELQIYRDLSTADQDVIRFRAPAAADNGSVRLDSGVDLVVHARDLLLSAACSASDPRAAYRAGRVKEAADYMDRVRLGQTERGSFIVTLLSPVTPALEVSIQPTLWPMPSEDPFERRVTRRLAEGLDEARRAIEASNRGYGFSTFEKAVSKGVSANLCEAAAILIEKGDGLEVSITWAQTRQTPERRRKVDFTQSDASVLKEAARVFRDREPRPDESLEGYIVNLSRNEDRGELDGRATLRAIVDNAQIAIRMDLPQSLYEEAVRAHESRLAVSIKGDLSREGHRWRLNNPRELSIVEIEDEPDPRAGPGGS